MLKKYSTLILLIFSLFFQNSISAEEKQKPLRFFNLDLHISVIADVKQIFESLGHSIENWSLSSHTFVFGKKRDKVEIVNENSWRDLNKEMCDQFYERYKDYLSLFDGFIVTHNSSFSLLYEKFNKPIIIINTTRYENPFSQDEKRWKWLNDYLQKGVKKNKIFIVSNNKADQAYLKHYAHIDSELIPSLCLYTHAKYTGKEKGFIFKALYGSKKFQKKIKKNPFKKNHLLKKNYKWQNLYDFQGIVHFPYQISTMSIFEQYSANIPLFFPSKKFLKALQKFYPKDILSQLSFLQVEKGSTPKTAGDLNNIYDPKVIQHWINLADFYDSDNMPHIQYFDSFKHLNYLLRTVDLQKISKKMKKHNAKRKQIAYEKWKKILLRIAQKNEV